MIFGCSLLLFSQSLTEYSDPMKQDKIHSLHQAPSFRVRNCVVWGSGWEGTVCSGCKDTLYATSPACSELRHLNPLVRKKIILRNMSPNEAHCTVILLCLRRKCFIRLSSRKLDPEERACFNLVHDCQEGSGFENRTQKDRGTWIPAQMGWGGTEESQQKVPDPGIPSHEGCKAFPVMTTHPSKEETQAPPCPGLASEWGAIRGLGIVSLALCCYTNDHYIFIMMYLFTPEIRVASSLEVVSLWVIRFCIISIST